MYSDYVVLYDSDTIGQVSVQQMVKICYHNDVRKKIVLSGPKLRVQLCVIGPSSSSYTARMYMCALYVFCRM